MTDQAKHRRQCPTCGFLLTLTDDELADVEVKFTKAKAAPRMYAELCAAHRAIGEWLIENAGLDKLTRKKFKAIHNSIKRAIEWAWLKDGTEKLMRP